MGIIDDIAGMGYTVRRVEPIKLTDAGCLTDVELEQIAKVNSLDWDGELAYLRRSIKSAERRQDWPSRAYFAEKLAVLERHIANEEAMNAAEAKAHSAAQRWYESHDDDDYEQPEDEEPTALASWD